VKSEVEKEIELIKNQELHKFDRKELDRFQAAERAERARMRQSYGEVNNENPEEEYSNDSSKEETYVHHMHQELEPINEVSSVSSPLNYSNIQPN